ncbi:sugar ABC transporter permease [Vagococcus carniphilus]|uniref:carbohydrate ABC transporter permease n=1 Tax=Vagococcus carniphilus TaxID=218144 RepID=UPI002890F219|nr:sugar ABC transporter permease [Vagococcus carniphilus]MDT2848665.1 sugar ABC transporter permease [Vagococcus carniphilus]
MNKKKPYLIFILPGFILYFLFVVYPIFSAAQISLFKWNGIGEKVFVGFSNYKELFSNPVLLDQFLNALKNSLIIFVLTALIIIPLQVIYAYMIYTKTKGSKILQTVIFSPQFISTPVIVFIFTLMLDANIGVVNDFLTKIGLDFLAKPWLGMPSIGIYIVWLMISWAGFGVGMMYFIAAMNMISTDALESAYLEGAGFWTRLRLIVVPQIKNTIFNLILISYITAMTIFDYSYILGGVSGGVDGSVDVMSLFFYRIAFGDNNPLGGNLSENSMGMGTTIAVTLFIIIFIVAVLQMVLTLRKDEQDG